MRSTKTTAAWSVFESAFREYGLPDRIRTDNGTPFASQGAGGLSRLSIWWVKLGIRHERIEPGHPEQNGRHERMHRTLKQETLKPPARTARLQQRRFEEFRDEYNHERPHEGIGNATPASLYRSSLREYSRRLAEMQYPDDFQTRRLPESGRVRWNGVLISISGPLGGELVGSSPWATSSTSTSETVVHSLQCAGEVAACRCVEPCAPEFGAFAACVRSHADLCYCETGGAPNCEMTHRNAFGAAPCESEYAAVVACRTGDVPEGRCLGYSDACAAGDCCAGLTCKEGVCQPDPEMCVEENQACGARLCCEGFRCLNRVCEPEPEP